MTNDEHPAPEGAPPPRSVFEIAERSAELHIHPVGGVAEIYRMEQARSGKARAAFIRVATLDLDSGEVAPVGARRLTSAERADVTKWLAMRAASGDDPIERARGLLADAAEAIRAADAIDGVDAQSLLMALHFARLQVVDRLLAPRNATLAASRHAAAGDLEEAARGHAAWGRFEEAEAAIRNALSKAPGDAELHRRLAELLNNQGRLEEARSANARAASLRPDGVEILRQRGHLAAMAGDWPAVAEAFERVAALAPGPDAWRMLGRARFEVGATAAAADALRRAAALAPEDGRIQALIAAVEVRRGNWGLARAAALRSVAGDAATVGDWLHLARSCVELADADEGARALARAAALAPPENRPAPLAVRFEALEARLAALRDGDV